MIHRVMVSPLATIRSAPQRPTPLTSLPRPTRPYLHRTAAQKRTRTKTKTRTRTTQTQSKTYLLPSPARRSPLRGSTHPPTNLSTSTQKRSTSPPHPPPRRTSKDSWTRAAVQTPVLSMRTSGATRRMRRTGVWTKYLSGLQNGWV